MLKHRCASKVTPNRNLAIGFFSVLLITNPDTAFSRETIFRKVWKQEYYLSTNLVDVCVHRLRQKIERNPAEPRYVVTVHGVGYMLARLPPVDADGGAAATSGGEPSLE